MDYRPSEFISGTLLTVSDLSIHYHCRLTPELSRPAAGWRLGASVAEKHPGGAPMRVRLERIVRAHCLNSATTADESRRLAIHPKSPLKPSAKMTLTTAIPIMKGFMFGAPGALAKLSCMEENIVSCRIRLPRFHAMPRTISPTKSSRAQFLRLSSPIDEASVRTETMRNARKKSWK